MRLAVGVGVAVAALGGVTSLRGAAVPIPVAATAIVLFAVPATTTTRLRVLLPAHALCGAVGLLALPLAGSAVPAVALAAGLVVALMRLARCWHVPAALTAVVACATRQDVAWVGLVVLPGAVAVWIVAALTAGRGMS